MIGVACAQTILAPAPITYSSYVYDEPKPSYEYSTSVQTPTYNNYAHVRSGNLFERRILAAPLAATPLVAAAAEPIIAEAKYVEPVSLFPFQLKFFIDINSDTDQQIKQFDHFRRLHSQCSKLPH